MQATQCLTNGSLVQQCGWGLQSTLHYNERGALHVMYDSWYDIMIPNLLGALHLSYSLLNQSFGVATAERQTLLEAETCLKCSLQCYAPPHGRRTDLL